MKFHSFAGLKNIFGVVFLGMSFLFFIESFPSKTINMLSAGLISDLEGEKDIDSAFDDNDSDASEVLGNPMKLMNVLRSIEEMNDATVPSDAIDDALKAFESENQLESSFDADIQ